MVIKKKVDPQYQKMIESIKLDEEEYCDEEIKPVYKEQKSKRNELYAMLGVLFITYAVDGLLKVNSTQKADITSQFDFKLKSVGKDLGDIEVNKVTDILSKVYQDTYYKNAYVMDSGMKVDLKFDILKKEFIDSVVNTEFKGEMYSDRIWKNKADMIDKLKSSLTDVMNGDTHLDKVAKDFEKTFNATAYESRRLINTESARVQSQASDDIAHSTNVTKQIYLATLDMKTSEECATLDGTIYDIDDPDKVIPPENHPNCRCVLCNMPSEDWQPTKRKDNETKEIIDYVNYSEWKQNKGIDED